MSAPDIQGGQVERMWDKIDILCEDVSEMKTDIALIKAHIQQTEDAKRVKLNTKNGIFMAGIGVVFGLIGSFVSRLFSN